MLFVEGCWPAPNRSGGFHGILARWWNQYFPKSGSVLLVSENLSTKQRFQQEYSEWHITTMNVSQEFGGSVDVIADVCVAGSLGNDKYDGIICQATLEHVYDPFGAMKNLFASLRVSGYLVIHTHTPKFPRHLAPTDCFRFIPDWFQIIPKHIVGLHLLDLFHDEKHVFACYQKVS